MMTDFITKYAELLRNASRPRDFNQILTSALRDYVSDNLTDSEYSRIWAACTARQNNL